VGQLVFGRYAGHEGNWKASARCGRLSYEDEKLSDADRIRQTAAFHYAKKTGKLKPETIKMFESLKGAGAGKKKDVFFTSMYGVNWRCVCVRVL
jgi:hypothetical protein